MCDHSAERELSDHRQIEHEEVLRGAASDFVLVPKPYGLASLSRGLSKALQVAAPQPS